jgi:hypothetical protein
MAAASYRQIFQPSEDASQIRDVEIPENQTTSSSDGIWRGNSMKGIHHAVAQILEAWASSSSSPSSSSSSSILF